jgi:glycine hydroxymethyltransferase
MKDFKKMLETDTPQVIQQLSHDVEDFAKQFPTIGFDKAEMRYTD